MSLNLVDSSDQLKKRAPLWWTNCNEKRIARVANGSYVHSMTWVDLFCKTGYRQIHADNGYGTTDLRLPSSYDGRDGYDATVHEQSPQSLDVSSASWNEHRHLPRIPPRLLWRLRIANLQTPKLLKRCVCSPWGYARLLLWSLSPQTIWWKGNHDSEERSPR